MISGNFLVSDKTGAELETIAENALSVIKKAAYIPIKSSVIVGNPCVELGDPIRFNTTREIVDSYVLQRTLTGIQSKRDSITSLGTETHSQNPNGIKGQIESVTRRTNKLERTADHTLSELVDLDANTSSRFEQTAEQIQTEVTRATGAESTLQSSITQTADAITAEVTRAQGAESNMSTRISQSAHSVSISASGSGNTAGITIALYDENGKLIDTTKTANITITGFVTFNDLSATGSTNIDGSRITTGSISCDRLNGGTIKGQKLEGCKAEFSDGAESLRLKYSDDYYMGLRAGFIYFHHKNPGNIYQSIVFDNLMRIGVNSNADCWGNGSGNLEPTYYMEIDKYGGINFNCYNLTKNNSALATKSDIPDIPDMSNYAKKANGTLSNPTLTGDIDAIGIKGRSSSATANVRCQDSSSHGYLAISAESSMRYKHDIADISDDRLNPERLYDLPVRQFVYNLDYLDANDQRYGETVCGFIAEEVANIYPVACEYNADGVPENWDIRYVIPPMLSLIQKQHQEIELLKQENLALQNRLSILEQKMEVLENAYNNKNN